MNSPAYTADVRRYLSAQTARISYEPTKKAAALLDVTPRSVQRHKKPQDAKGSPVYRHDEVIEAAAEPVALAAHAFATAVSAKLRRMTTADLVIRYNDFRREDVRHEGVVNAMAFDARIAHEEVAAAHEVDAWHDLEMAAIRRILAERRHSPAALMGS